LAIVPPLGEASFQDVVQMKSMMLESLDRLRGNLSDNAAAPSVASGAMQEMTLSL
ncbi:hypothetical protein BGZ70_008020, partial [Mortierella alpina]